MNILDWLTKYRFENLERREHDWVFHFDAEAHLVVSCLWRLCEHGRICVTSQDDGHKFGLPMPVDAVAYVDERITDAVVTAVELRDRTLDLRIEFSSGHVLEVIPSSSGYEAWDLSRENQQFIAVGGGKLTVFGDGSKQDTC
ncbi:MAG: DUF6188 family protein [Pirellulales bacterium]